MTFGDYNGYFAGKTVLVTGGAGFIGSHLTQHLTDLRCKVRVLDDFSSGHRSNLDGIDSTLIEGSILDRSALDDAISGCSIVFHQAAFVSVPKSFQEPDKCRDINETGTRQVVDAAVKQGCESVVFASSAACYGSTPLLPSSETDPVSLESPYAESKYACEQLLSSRTDLRCVSLRYFNVFGARQGSDSHYSAVVSAFSDAVAQGRTPEIFGDGMQTRDFTHVDNIVHANLLAASHNTNMHGACFNVGTGKALSLLDLLRAVTDKEDPRVSYKPARDGDVQHSCANIDAIGQALGYTTIRDTVRALRGLVSPRLS